MQQANCKESFYMVIKGKCMAGVLRYEQTNMYENMIKMKTEKNDNFFKIHFKINIVLNEK